MSKHQVGLHRGRKSRGGVVEQRVEAYRRGQSSLRDALGVPEHVLGELRDQAHALFGAGKWQRCIDVLLGLEALGNVKPLDPLMLSRCFDELMDADRASMYAKIADGVLSQLNAGFASERPIGAEL